MQCRNCGAPMEPGEKFCASCGTPAEPKVNLNKESPPAPASASKEADVPKPQDAQNEQTHNFCEMCGAKLPAGASACPQCGQPVNSTAHDAGSHDTQSNSPAPAPGKPKRPKWVIPVIAASAAGIVLIAAFGTQALTGGWFSSEKNMIVPAQSSASAATPSASTSSAATARPSSIFPSASAAVRSAAPAASAKATSQSKASSKPVAVQREAAQPAAASFTLSDAQSAALMHQVVWPLLQAHAQNFEATERPTTYDTDALTTYNADDVTDFRPAWHVLDAVMFRQQDHEALNGRPGSERIRWRERFSPSEYNYVLPEGYPPNIDQLTGTVVPWETIQSFLSDAFGVSDLALDDVKTQDGQYVILLDSDPGGWATEPVGSVPLKAENGIITLNGIASWDGDGPAKEYEIQLHVVQDPSSRYGCNVKSVTFVPVRDVYDSDTDASGAAPAASRGFDANGFVFADSSERYLTAEDLQGLSKEMLAFARNEIFARNGNVFKTDKYINHYTKYAWYNNMPNKRYDINPEELSAIEQANIRLIRQFEAA